jgi:hypothetical protein
LDFAMHGGSLLSYFGIIPSLNNCVSSLVVGFSE